jgi:LPXTG-site transpeptidase (sortase) family protein
MNINSGKQNAYMGNMNPRATGAGIHKKQFATIWFMVFCVMFTASSVLGIFPEVDDKTPITPEAFADVANSDSGENVIEAETPLRIRADSIGMNTPILNPESADIAVLDGELAKGAVRYPGSGIAGEKANMFVFGHSSQLPVVNNQAYKAFNNIEKFEKGDEITVQSKNNEYVYKVVSVREAKAAEVSVEFKSDKPMLTLSTCNTFENFKEDRFVVEAELVKVIKN